MVFGNGVKTIQAADYNGARTVTQIKFQFQFQIPIQIQILPPFCKMFQKFQKVNKQTNY